MRPWGERPDSVDGLAWECFSSSGQSFVRYARFIATIALSAPHDALSSPRAASLAVPPWVMHPIKSVFNTSPTTHYIANTAPCKCSENNMP